MKKRCYLFLLLVACKIAYTFEVTPDQTSSSENDKQIVVFRSHNDEERARFDARLLRSLQSPVLNEASSGVYKADHEGTTQIIPFDVPVSSEALRAFARLLAFDKSKRLTEALKLPPATQFELCLLYEYLSCDGLFQNGLPDAQQLSANVCMSKEFLAEYGSTPEFKHLSCVEPKLAVQVMASVVDPARRRTVAMMRACRNGHAWYAGNLFGMALSLDGKQLACCDMCDSWLYDIEQKCEIKSCFKGGNSLCFRPNEKLLLVTSVRKELIFCDINKREMKDFMPGMSGFNGIFNHDGTLIASAATWPYTVKIWEVRTKQQVAEFKPDHDYGRGSMRFSPDGKFLACRASDGTIFLLSTTNWQLLRSWNVLLGHQRGESQFPFDPEPLAFSPNSKILAVIEYSEHCGHKILLIDVETGKCIHTLADHTGPVSHVAWGPNYLLASCSLDGTAILYDLNQRLSVAQMLLVLKMAHAPQIHSAEQKARLVEILQTLGPEHADIRATLLEKMNAQVIKTVFAEAARQKKPLFDSKLHVE